VNNPQLVINNVDRDDAGIYKLEVISPTETKSSPGILLELYGGKQKYGVLVLFRRHFPILSMTITTVHLCSGESNEPYHKYKPDNAVTAE
jgi:hypothetical protein